MTAKTPIVLDGGVVRDVPLNRLKASPANARKTPHGADAIAALAASIAAKGVLQALVVAPEFADDGEPTGDWLVTIGEGRRQALRLLASRKVIAKDACVRCVVDTDHDPHEISLDENVTRSEMHPADQFEAFRRLAEQRGLDAEAIAGRFGVSAQLVRQRLRLGAVSPRLMAAYRAAELTLDQLMAFAVSEDHARQEQVFDQLSWNRSAHLIRRAMTEAKVAAHDRRAVFVGAETYLEAGGTLLRDLFTEDGGGWLEDVGLIDRLTADKLADLAEAVREREGWKWAEAHLDYPHGHGWRRVYPRPVERPAAVQAEIAALSEEYDALVSQWDAVDDLPEAVGARFAEIDAALEAYGEAVAYDPDEIARGGLIVVLGHDGQARIERGFIRAEDEAPPPSDEETEAPPDGAAPMAAEAMEAGEADEAAGAPLSERLVANLTAHRTQALRDALAASPALALAAVVHGLALPVFYPGERASCLELKAVSAWLGGHAPGIEDSPAGRAAAERHAAWAARLPRAAGDLWTVVRSLAQDEVLALLAHVAALSLNAVRTPLDRRPAALAHAGALASDLGLDMARHWSPTADSYLGQVTKARILDAVREGVSAEAATAIAELKKPEMVEAAEGLLAGTGWLPALLRTAPSEGLPVPMAAE